MFKSIYIVGFLRIWIGETEGEKFIVKWIEKVIYLVFYIICFYGRFFGWKRNFLWGRINVGGKVDGIGFYGGKVVVTEEMVYSKNGKFIEVSLLGFKFYELVFNEKLLEILI